MAQGCRLVDIAVLTIAAGERRLQEFIVEADGGSRAGTGESLPPAPRQLLLPCGAPSNGEMSGAVSKDYHGFRGDIPRISSKPNVPHLAG